MASASVKAVTTDYMNPVRPALYTEKKTVPTEVSVSCLFMGLFSTREVCDVSTSVVNDLSCCSSVEIRAAY